MIEDKTNIEVRYDDQLQNETTIWKYMSFPAFVSFVIESKLLFRRFDKFSDKLEGTMPERARIDLYNHFKSINNYLSDEEANKKVDIEAKNIEKHKKWAYANSWSINKNENYALWKIYLDNYKEGVAVKSTVKRLKDSIIYDPNIIKNGKPIIIKRVNYNDTKWIDVNQEEIYTYKYSYYKYESELRIFFKNQKDLTQNKNSEVDIYEGFNDSELKFLGIDIKKLVSEVYISPFADRWFSSMIVKLFENKFHDLNLKFVNSKIEE